MLKELEFNVKGGRLIKFDYFFDLTELLLLEGWGVVGALV
jgi:hypothetical protein